MSTLFTKALFWDVSRVNPKIHQKFIIERILNFGDEEDFKWALDHYGKDKIIKTLIKSKTLSNKSLLFWCRYFNINTEQCLASRMVKKQSAFWNR
jgi:hypothetical protein